MRLIADWSPKKPLGGRLPKLTSHPFLSALRRAREQGKAGVSPNEPPDEGIDECEYPELESLRKFGKGLCERAAEDRWSEAALIREDNEMR